MLERDHKSFRSTDYFKSKPVKFTEITILQDHGYHIDYLIEQLEKVYPQIMTKITMPDPSNLLAAPWLKPIIHLVRERDFEEAYELAEYFPATPGRLLVQCAALLGQKEMAEAAELLQELSVNIREVAADFRFILSGAGVDLLEAGLEAVENNYSYYCPNEDFYLRHLCLESHLLTHPESVQAVIDGMVKLASQALKYEKLDLGRGYLERALELDNSLLRQIEYAEVALAPRPFQNSSFTRAVAFSPDGQTIVTSSKYGTVQLWNCQGKLINTFRSHKEFIRIIAVAFSPDGQTIVTGSYDGTVQLWNCQGELINSFSGHEEPIRAVAFSPDGQTIVTSSYYRTVRLWDCQGNPLSLLFEEHEDWIRTVAFSPDGQTIVTGSNNGTVQLWNCQGELINTFSGHGEPIIAVAFNSDGQTILTGSEDGTIRLWNCQGELINTFPDHGEPIRAIAFSPDGQFIMSGSSEDEYGTFGLWNLQSNSVCIQLKSPYPLSEFAEDDLINRVLKELASKDITSQVVRSVLIVGCKLGNLKSCIERLVQLETSPDIFLEVAQALIEDKTESDEVVNLCLEQALQQEPQPHAEVIAAYIRLSILAQEHRQNKRREEFLARALNLSTNFLFLEFFIYGEEIRSEIVFLTLELQNFILNKIEEYLINFIIEKNIKNIHILASLESIGDNFDDSDTETLSLKDFYDRARVKIERYTRIDFPAFCIKNTTVKLKIQLVKNSPKITRSLEKITILSRIGVEQVELGVNVTAPGFKMEKSHQPMFLPVNGDSNEVTFDLRPLKWGEQVIEIEFFQDGLRVGYVVVKTYVDNNKYSYEGRSYSETQTAAQVISQEAPIKGIEELAKVTTDTNHIQRTLIVNWNQEEDKLYKLYYEISSKISDELKQGEQTVPITQKGITEYWQRLNEILANKVMIALPDQEEWERITSGMKRIGEDLFNTLIPYDLRERIQKWQSDSRVFISTNEQWIPWELMHDGEDFLGKKFILVRCPRFKNGLNIPEASRPESKGTRQIRRVVNVVGGGIETSAAGKATELFNSLLPPLPVALLPEKPIYELEKAVPGADAVHYTCHGHLKPHMLQIAKDKTEEQNLCPEMVENLPLEPGCLVFANACASAIPVLTADKFDCFAWEFYRRGTDVFVGTLGRVPADEAVSFAETVYRELFRKDIKRTIGEAVTIAKREAYESREIFGLLYCIYGNPDFCIDHS